MRIERLVRWPTTMKKAVLQLVSVLRRPAVWVPAAVLIAGTGVFWATNIDIDWVRPFYSGGGGDSGTSRPWPWEETQPWKVLKDWGFYPGLVLGIGGIVVWITSFFWLRIERWRDPGLFFALVLIIGPGILVNLVCKPYWSRPRPRATKTFQGPRDFLPVLYRGFGEEDSSFPSGHAAMGFYLMTPAFVCRRRPWTAAAFLVFGLSCGVMMGLARMVAGAHFPSDVFWSGGLIYFTALLVAAPFRFGREFSQGGVS
jgi:lipid A 4'-phosphatase